MFTYLSGHQFILIIGSLVAIYYGAVALYFRRQFAQPAAPGNSVPPVSAQMPIQGKPHELIGQQAPEWQEELEMFLESDPDGTYSVEMLEDDDSILLKEAERVVEEIQDVINHVASHPANPEEVFTKMNAIVRQYRIFQNTEYFEAINAFIAQAVLRECEIEWTPKDLAVLWN